MTRGKIGLESPTVATIIIIKKYAKTRGVLRRVEQRFHHRASTTHRSLSEKTTRFAVGPSSHHLLLSRLMFPHDVFFLFKK
jgi:hypothetical protein